MLSVWVYGAAYEGAWSEKSVHCRGRRVGRAAHWEGANALRSSLLQGLRTAGALTKSEILHYLRGSLQWLAATWFWSLFPQSLRISTTLSSSGTLHIRMSALQCLAAVLLYDFT